MPLEELKLACRCGPDVAALLFGQSEHPLAIHAILHQNEGRPISFWCRGREAMNIHQFLERYIPWRYARLYYRTFGLLRRLVRWIRYRRMPKGGWGQGWRVLVFRYEAGRAPPSKGQLHVLAPVNGDEFDWELLRRHVRGEPWPEYMHEPGRLTGVMIWVGHHIGVAAEGLGQQRVPMDKLIPGEFRGGVLDVGLILIDVRPATF